MKNGKDKIEVFMAKTLEEYEDAQRVVAQGYAEKGYIPSPKALREYPMWYVICKVNGEVAGVIGLYRYNGKDLIPIDIFFKLNGGRAKMHNAVGISEVARSSVIEVGRFAKATKFLGHHLSTLALLYGCYKFAILTGGKVFAFSAKKSLLEMLTNIGFLPIEYVAKVNKEAIPSEYSSYFLEEGNNPAVFCVYIEEAQPKFIEHGDLLSENAEMTFFTKAEKAITGKPILTLDEDEKTRGSPGENMCDNCAVKADNVEESEGKIMDMEGNSDESQAI